MNRTVLPPSVAIRHEIRPGDLGAIVRLHGILYAREYGFDPTFEAYVAGPLSQFVLSHTDRERFWIAERDDQFIGCIAIVRAETDKAQLRWFLVDPSVRGMGLGKRLIDEAISFSRQAGYRSILLWTVSVLAAAAALYRSCGFERVEANPAKRWGVEVIEEKYLLHLDKRP